jgi:flagellum-specific peptidoglycan hydrolase FlgJ
VAKAGYATDPHYADKLIAMIEKYQLEALDLPPEAR